MTFVPDTVGALNDLGHHGWTANAQSVNQGHVVAHALSSVGADASEDGTGRGTPLVADPITRSYGKQCDSSDRAAGPVNLIGGVRRLTPTECERLQGLPDGWTLPGSDSKRYAGLGDAVTANVAEWIGRRLTA